MKVIFLDHDGVICLSSEWGSRRKKQDKWRGPKRLSMSMNEYPVEIRFDNFNAKAIKVLNEILETTGAEIVVSSDWRYHASIEEMGMYYDQQGIIKKPIGFTPRSQDIDPEIWKRNSFSKSEIEREREFEIRYWLSQHPEVTHWVAIDDLHMGKYVEASRYGPHERDWGLENFVWTPHDSEGIKQLNKKEKIIQFLL